MTPLLTIVSGVLLGIAGTCLAALWVSSENDYAASVLPGQRWKVKGLGIITIKETLTGGKYYHQYGAGTNVSYITQNGRVGHCPKHAITKHGTLIKKMANVTFVADEEMPSKDVLRTYNRRGRVVNDGVSIDAEFCDADTPSNVYHLARRRK